jgi:lactoylglutathione lyase
MTSPQVFELRLVITTQDFDAARRRLQDVLGMATLAEFDSPGRVVLLDAGRATLELADVAHAEHVDEVEVGARVAGTIRVALCVDDVERAARELTAEGATVLAEPRLTPWGSLNARLDDPDGIQLTLFDAGDEALPAA